MTTIKEAYDNISNSWTILKKLYGNGFVPNGEEAYINLRNGMFKLFDITEGNYTIEKSSDEYEHNNMFGRVMYYTVKFNTEYSTPKRTHVMTVILHFSVWHNAPGYKEEVSAYMCIDE